MIRRFGWCALALVALLGVWVATKAWSVFPLVTASADGSTGVVSYPVDKPPVLDGKVDPQWRSAPPTQVILMRGRQSQEPALEVEMRAIHTEDAVYFMVHWPDPTPAQDAQAEHNRLILHFSVPSPWEGAEDLMCLTACHTAYVDGAQQGAYVTAETIPPGLTAPLPIGGGWRDGAWTLEWGRPLVSANPFDVQFNDLGDSYPFFVKVLEARPGQPDPVSRDLSLSFCHEP